MPLLAPEPRKMVNVTLTLGMSQLEERVFLLAVSGRSLLDISKVIHVDIKRVHEIMEGLNLSINLVDAAKSGAILSAVPMGEG